MIDQQEVRRDLTKLLHLRQRKGTQLRQKLAELTRKRENLVVRADTVTLQRKALWEQIRSVEPPSIVLDPKAMARFREDIARLYQQEHARAAELKQVVIEQDKLAESHKTLIAQLHANNKDQEKLQILLNEQ